MMGIQGNLSTMNVSDLLQFLAAGKEDWHAEIPSHQDRQTNLF